MDCISDFHEGLAFVEKDKKVGVINKMGEIVVEPTYDAVPNLNSLRYENGFAIVQKNGKYGFIDKKGKEIVSCEYEVAEPFSSEGFSAVKKNGKYGFIDKTGHVIIDFIYDNASSFSEGLSSVRKNEKFGYIDNKGETVIPFVYSKASSFYGNVAIVVKDDKYSIIDKAGNVIKNFNSGIIDDYSDGLAAYAEYAEAEYGYIDEKGNLVIRCADGGAFKDGYASVLDYNEKKIGVIDKSGKTILPFIFDYVKDISEGLFCVLKDDKYGYYDNSGKCVIQCEYEEANSFSEGLAVISKEGRTYGYIDKSGLEVISPVFDSAHDFSEGLAVVKKNGLYGYIDKNGNSTFDTTIKEKTDGKDYTETDIKNVVEEMYKELFSLEYEIDFYGKYTSNEYKSLYKKAESIAAGDCVIGSDLWTNSQDSDEPSLKSISVKKYSDTTAKANVAIKLFKDYETISHVKLALIYEGGRWVVDDFLIDDNGKEFSAKAYLKEYIEDSLNKPKDDFSWLQGHWVYEQGNYRGHFVIQGNTLTMYSTMNPEPLTYTYRVEGNELFAGEMTVKLDFANQRIDYGEGNWMHKTSSDSNTYSSISSNSSSQTKTFANEQYVTGYLANQTFENSSGVDIRIDGSLRMYIDGDYAGVISVLRYNSTSALLRYGGGAYGEGKIGVRIENGRLQLRDPIDGIVWYQK
jgi:hypothetical protein